MGPLLCAHAPATGHLHVSTLAGNQILFLLLLSLLAGAGTLLGAVLALLIPLDRTLPFLAGFAGGVMSSVVATELLPASVALGGPGSALGGCLTGGAFLFFFDLLLPHRPAARDEYRRLGWLLFTAIALHDLPEGIALGTGGSAAAKLGVLLAVALGAHNLPEGLINTVPLRLGGLGAKGLIALNLLLSLITPLGTLIGVGIAEWQPRLIPVLLALAAGAMLYIVLKELLPRMVDGGGGTGFICGFLLLILLWWFLERP